MQTGTTIDARVPWIRELPQLNAAWAEPHSGRRVDALQRAGQELRSELKAEAPVHAVRTIPIGLMPYPAHFAFNGALRIATGYILLAHRAVLVQCWAEGKLRNVLFNPTDPIGARTIPWFVDMLGKLPRSWVDRIVDGDPVLAGLAKLGIAPEEIDIVAWDHLHAQDFQRLFRNGRHAGRFEHAHLLVDARGWAEWRDLHPMQRPWFSPRGYEGVPAERLILTGADLWLGEGCTLLRSPGHTAGNQTLFVHASDGLFGISENAVCADCWSPAASPMRGVRDFARRYRVPVVINANTPQFAGDQYASMVLERTLADPCPRADGMVQMFPSSEFVRSPLSPWVHPRLIYGERACGELHVRSAAAAAA